LGTVTREDTPIETAICIYATSYAGKCAGVARVVYVQQTFLKLDHGRCHKEVGNPNRNEELVLFIRIPAIRTTCKSWSRGEPAWKGREDKGAGLRLALQRGMVNQKSRCGARMSTEEDI